MAIIKCKMCGGDLDVNLGMSVGVCQSCGSTMTLPKEADEKKANLYNRANHFRRNNEFDKASGMYESILNQDASEAEAYWGLVLCNYGIEYVEDPKTHERVPTCHRAQYTSIFSDPNYKAALEQADSSAKAVYEAEAQTIDHIQKQILEISSKEDPFDVFICYKETSDAGTRTPDSVLAQDLYYQLVSEGFKVFFSRITLEDKLGSAYEPYIFAALNSARVMVVIGTKPEYINSVWVKNEWGRYLSLIKKGEKKILIPAYRDMDPYDLPEEFSHLQAQDMSKLGFMQDLTRGIKKLLGEAKITQSEKDSQPSNQSSPTVNSLLERAYLCLELGDFNKADHLLEQVLNLAPKNSSAYIGKLMAELNIKDRIALGDGIKDLRLNKNYQMALRFAYGQTREDLEGYNRSILDRLETERKESIYQDATNINKRSSKEWLEGVALMRSIPGHKDADQLADQWQATADEITYKINQEAYDQAMEIKSSSQNDYDYTRAAHRFHRLGDFADSKEQEEECRWLGKEYVYREGMRLKTAPYQLEKVNRAAEKFLKLGDFQDSTNQLLECEQLITSLEKRNKKIILITTSSLIAIVLITVFLLKVIIPGIKYRNGLNNMEAGQYDKAAEVFSEIGNYKDSAELANSSLYQKATQLLGEKKFDEAAEVFSELGDYKDSAELAKTLYYQKAKQLSDEGNYIDALITYGKTSGYLDSFEIQKEILREHDINIQIGASDYHTVGLKADGTVVAVGSNSDGQLDVSDWQGIIAISTGDEYTVGLKADGTVVAVGNSEYNKLKVSKWQDIIAISAGAFHTVGLKADGTVVAVGANAYGKLDVSDWQDIIAISAGVFHTMGLKADGTVVAVGDDNSGQLAVSDWILIK